MKNSWPENCFSFLQCTPSWRRQQRTWKAPVCYEQFSVTIVPCHSRISISHRQKPFVWNISCTRSHGGVKLTELQWQLAAQLLNLNISNYAPMSLCTPLISPLNKFILEAQMQYHTDSTQRYIILYNSCMRIMSWGRQLRQISGNLNQLGFIGFKIEKRYLLAGFSSSYLADGIFVKAQKPMLSFLQLTNKICVHTLLVDIFMMSCILYLCARELLKCRG